MDIFNYNWTERIKNEPFVNKKLNYDKKPESLEYSTILHNPYLGSQTYKTKYLYSETNLRLYQNEVKRPIEPAKPNYFYHYLVPSSAKINYRKIENLQQNTRPNSLYNLRYASKRN